MKELKVYDKILKQMGWYLCNKLGTVKNVYFSFEAKGKLLKCDKTGTV